MAVEPSTAGGAATAAQPAIVITPAYRRYALAILLLAYTSSFVDRSIVGILIEPIKNDLHLSDTQLGFMSGIAFAIFYATLGMPIAMLADRANRRNIISIAVFVWSIMTALCGLAQNFWQLAAARVGVGIGEAGSSPPSHSMIADLYPRDKRSGAMAIYSLGVYLGTMIGFVVGGWVAQHWGWREAFFVVGLPGVIIALLVRFTMKEPPRGHADGVAMEIQEKGQFKRAAAYLWKTRAARHVILGVTLTSFVGYGGLVWGAAFLIRSHGMTPEQVGLFLGPASGVVGGIGALSGGYLADRLARKDIRWNAWILTIAKILAIPFIIGFYLVDDTTTAILLYLPGLALGAFYLGPSFSMIQGLAPLHMRALAAAIMLFVLNIIGLGFGPQLVGLLSDALTGPFGSDSLRYALLFTSLINILAAFHYFHAGKVLKEDMDAAIAAEKN